MKEIRNLYGQYGFYTILIVLSGLVAHVVFFALDSMSSGQLIPDTLAVLQNPAIVKTWITVPFLTESVFEIIFSVLILVIWFTMRRTLNRLHEAQIRKERYNTAVQAHQNLMAILAQNIGAQNNRILQKIEFRRAKGQNVSPTIEEASRNIARILGILSELSFVEAYRARGEILISPLELQKTLETRIQDVSPGADSKNQKSTAGTRLLSAS